MQAYSYSSLTLFDKCPRAFRYRYVDRIEEAFATIEQHLGKVVHDSLEQLYAAAAKGENPDHGWLTGTYDRLWNSPDLAAHRIVKPGKTVEAYFMDGLALVGSFLERVFRTDRSRTLHLEHRFTFALTDEEEEHAYTGVIDRVSLQPDGTVRITDYKTGRSVPDPAEDLQMKSYALHVLALHGGERLQLCFEDLRGAQTKAAVFHAREAERVRAHLLAGIRRIEDESEYPTRPSILCGWCGFNAICTPGAAPRARGARRM